MRRYHVSACSRKLLLGLFAAISLAFLLAGGAFAAEEVRVLTLEDALQTALEKNRDIQKALEYRNKVMGIYVEQRAAALPQVTATGTGTRSWDEALAAIFMFPNQEIRSAEIGLSQALYTWGQIGAAIRAAKYGLATADDQLRLYRQAALRDVSATFYDVLLAREFHTIARQNLEQKTNHLDEARRKFSAGVATEYDVLAAEVAVENARPEVIRTENLIRTSRERLRFLLGLSGEEVDARGQLYAPLELETRYEEALQTAWKKRPELSDLRNRLGVSKELVKVAAAGDKPRLDLKASAGYKEFNIGPSEFEGKTWSVGLVATFPFFDGLRTRGKVAQAKSEVSTLKIEEAKQMDAIALQVRDAVNAVREAGEIVAALSGTVAQAERLLFMAEKGYGYGVKTHLDVEDAELNVTQARGNLARARRDYLVAKVTLTWAMGVLGE
jgi:outer membrane protein TolC